MRQLDDVVDESVVMQAMHPALFDDYLAEGWRLLGYSIIRHNFAICRGVMCSTIPLRIRLDGFEFSKSQRKLMQRNKYLIVEHGPIRVTEQKEVLFLRHSERFDERRPGSLASFLNPQSHREPVPGTELHILIPDRPDPVAYSFFHTGAESVSGTYCFFNPDFEKLSLGLYSMLLEIAYAQAAGKKYYYHGYCYDVPSQFDYKLNLNNLEEMNWKTGQWSPRKRLPVRRWVDEVEPGLEFDLASGKRNAGFEEPGLEFGV